MTVTANIETSITTIGNNGPRRSGRSRLRCVTPQQDPPRLVDVGTNHLCFTVGDIDAAAGYLAARQNTSVLGDAGAL